GALLVVLRRAADGPSALVALPVDGGPARRLAEPPPGPVGLRAITPGGWVIVEARDPEARTNQLYAASRGGEGELRRLSAPASGSASYFRAVARGEDVIFTANDRPLPEGRGDTEIYVVPAAGGEAALL